MMTGREQFYCSNCATKVDATKTPQLLASPTFFALGLNRFEWNPSLWSREKLYKKVKIPYLLDTVKSGVSNSYYILLAVVFHQGDESSGHYTNVMRSIADAQTAYDNNTYHFGNWMYCNDRTKELINFRKFDRWMNSYGDPTPYQCVYYKVDQVVPPTSIVIPTMI